MIVDQVTLPNKLVNSETRQSTAFIHFHVFIYAYIYFELLFYYTSNNHGLVKCVRSSLEMDHQFVST